MTESTQTEQPAFSMPQPGEQHRGLRPFEGKFRSEVKMWMGPGEPMVSSGVMTNTLELDGLYLQQDYEGDSQPGAPARFLGKGFWGYNTTSKQFEGFWIDNGSTTMQFEQGHVDSSGKVWTMTSDVVNPRTKQTMHKRSVITLLDRNRHKMEMYFSEGTGAETKSMEINYQRMD